MAIALKAVQAAEMPFVSRGDIYGTLGWSSAFVNSLRLINVDISSHWKVNVLNYLTKQRLFPSQ